MIPAGRTGLGTADVAALLNRKALSRTVRESLPAPISREGARTFIWDAEQIKSHVAGDSIPELSAGMPDADELLDAERARLELQDAPTPEAFDAHVRDGSVPAPDTVIDGVPYWKRATIRRCDDLLDREEARLELRNQITAGAWGSYIHEGRVPDPDTTVAGVPHWKRLTIRSWDANRPGERAGGGRPKGVKETKPRARNPEKEARRARLQELAPDGELPAAEIAKFAEAEGISERTVFRLLQSIREANG
ncbi:hypothetical protein ACFC36_33860 [Streptomyces rubiginosohelvolus]|uniref:hypothetical protein n=1 Tax=Streptomyces rubiginosohelvolus TaxID=67362 RepID=UPI0035D675D0